MEDLAVGLNGDWTMKRVTYVTAVEGFFEKGLEGLPTAGTKKPTALRIWAGGREFARRRNALVRTPIQAP